MKKTISINIAGSIFYIEEDAYAMLDEYLKSIKSHFSSYPDHEEIISDMEGRIAEQFSFGKESQKDIIVNLQQVEQLIATMGRVEDFGSEEEKQSSAQQSNYRKLYRDTDNAILAGVSSGLGAYFGIDPILFRLFFIILIFAGASGVLAYIILWVVMPEAKTSTEKLQMKGEPTNLSELEKSIKQNVGRINSEKALGGIKRLGNALAQVIKVMLKVVTKLISLLLTVAVSFAILVTTFVYVTTIFNKNSPYIDFPLSQITSGGEYYFILSLVYLTAIIPLVLIALLALSILRGKNWFNLPRFAGILGAWFLVLIISGAMAVKYAPTYEARINNLPGYELSSKDYPELKDFTKLTASSALKINIKQGDGYSVKASGRQIDLDRLAARINEDNLRLEQNNRGRVCIFCFSSRSVNIDMTVPNLDQISAHGATQVTADNLTPETLKVLLTGASSANLKFATGNLSIETSGASKATLSGSATDAIVDLSGASKINFTNLTLNKLTLFESGSSSVSVSGKGTDLIADLSGASKLMAEDFPLKTGEIELSGSSSTIVNITDSIKLKASGASRMHYYGTPKIDSNLSGSSRVIQED